MRKGNLQTLGCFVLFVFVLFSLSEASTFIENKDEPFSFQNDLAQGDLEQAQKIFKLTHASYLAYESDSIKGDESVDVYGFKGKSVKKAFFYSLIVPGSGEFYAGSKIKAAIFFGLDVAFWSFFFNDRKKGKDEEDQYEAFADTAWQEQVYRDWWAPLDDTLKEKYTHTLPDERTQQYYEMIGKYKQFAFAWKDFDDNTAGEDSLTPYRNRYLDWRRHSNDLLDKAKYSAMFSLGNHILSAFDAALTVKRHNKRGEKFSQVEFKMRLVERNQELIPRLSATLRF